MEYNEELTELLAKEYLRGLEGGRVEGHNDGWQEGYDDGYDVGFEKGQDNALRYGNT